MNDIEGFHSKDMLAFAGKVQRSRSMFLVERTFEYRLALVEEILIHHLSCVSCSSLKVLSDDTMSRSLGKRGDSLEVQGTGTKKTGSWQVQPRFEVRRKSKCKPDDLRDMHISEVEEKEPLALDYEGIYDGEPSANEMARRPTQPAATKQ